MKGFLTYEEQIKYLNENKGISCRTKEEQIILIKTGYFNLINGYKMPFVTQKLENKHEFLPETNIMHLKLVKDFDDELRKELLNIITKVEEELRSLVSYKFSEINYNLNLNWNDIKAYDENQETTKVLQLIGKIENEINNNKEEYIKFYKEKDEIMPIWVLIKVINFSTFITFIELSKSEVKNSICELYNMKDKRDCYNYKLLIGSLHWLRKIRNKCAHNERVYQTIAKGRIKNETYINNMPRAYIRENKKNILDLLIYLKYYLNEIEYNNLIKKIKVKLLELKPKIHINAFEKVRASLGIKDMDHLEILLSNHKNVEYNKLVIDIIKDV